MTDDAGERQTAMSTGNGAQSRRRCAVVTAGAGSIGAACCLALSEDDIDIVVADIDADRSAAVVEEITAQGGTAIAVVADLTEAGGIEELRRAASDRFGAVDILVNGLGHHLRAGGEMEHSTEEQWEALYKINLLHVFRACKVFLPGMRERGWGRIINLTSVEGVRAGPWLAVYTAFKGAVNSFTKSLAVDVAGDGVIVNSIAVDKTKSYQTGFYELSAEFEQFVPVWMPAGRFGEGKDIAAIVRFLAGDDSSWIVGNTIIADGGTVAAGGWFRSPRRWTTAPLMADYLEGGRLVDTDKLPPWV